MPVFPSTEWMTAFGEQLADHPDAASVATALDGVYRFVVEPAGPLQTRHVYDVAIRPAGGRAEVEVLDPDGQAPRLTLTADYTRWRQLIRGELDVGLALLMRRLRISGELRSVSGSLSNAQPLVTSLSQVETQWLD